MKNKYIPKHLLDELKANGIFKRKKNVTYSDVLDWAKEFGATILIDSDNWWKVGDDYKPYSHGGPCNSYEEAFEEATEAALEAYEDWDIANS